MSVTDAGAATGDGRVDDLGRFAAAHGPSLLRFAFLLTGGHGGQAEDLVQTVLARLADRGLAGVTEPRAYARRAILNEYRQQSRHADVHRRVMPRLGTARPEPDGEVDDRLIVLAALAELSERERAVIVLRYYEDLPDDDIAAIVGCARPTVRSLIHRALPKLKHRLAGEQNETAPGGATHA